MNGRLVGVALLIPLAAACSGSSSSGSGSGPSPSAVTTTASSAAVKTVLAAYGVTIATDLPKVSFASTDLGQCARNAAKCQHALAATKAAAGTVQNGLGKDDQLRQATTNGVLAPGVSPVIVLSEQDAARVRREAGSVSATSSRADIARLAARVKVLETEMGKWIKVQAAAG